MIEEDGVDKESQRLKNIFRRRHGEEEYNFFVCPECDKDKEDYTPMSAKEFTTHLNEVHNIQTKEGTRSMKAHFDSTKWFAYIWRWEIGGMLFEQHTKEKRSAESRKYWR